MPESNDRDALLDAFFKRLQQHDRISPEEREALRSVVGPAEAVESGYSIVNHGERPGTSTLLLRGMAARSRQLSDGARQIVAIHLPGDFVDLHSFLLKEMDHDVGMLSGGVIARVRHAGLATITETFPHLTRLLWLLTLIDAAIMREWAVSLGRRSALQRMAHLLCELHLRMLTVGLDGDGTFELPISQITLGDMLGLSVVHTNRILQELRAKGLVSWEGHTVRLLDAEALATLADFDELYLHRKREER